VNAARERSAAPRRAIFAALAGPALVAVIAAGFAFALSGAHASGSFGAAAARGDRASKRVATVVHLTAKPEAATARAKAPPEVAPARRLRGAILSP
jgi:hypothetical protein